METKKVVENTRWWMRIRWRSIRGYLFVAGLLLVSFLYLSKLVTVLHSTLEPSCVANNESISISFWFVEDVLISCKSLTLNEVGDYFAGLVSLLATMWLVVAFIWQAMELYFQRNEFKETNRIALERLSSEAVWRTIEYHDRLRTKLFQTVNECLRIEARLSGSSSQEQISLTSELVDYVESDYHKLDKENFGAPHYDRVNRYNGLVDESLLIVKALKEIESHPEFSKYIAPIR